MKIKNQYVIEDDFLAAFDGLLKKDMTAKQCLEMIQSIEVLTTHYKTLKNTQLTIVKKYAVLNDHGEVTFLDGTKIAFKSLEDDIKCNKELVEIRQETIDIPLSSKIKIYDDDVSTPRKMWLLSDIVEIVDRPVSETKK
jgi:hypothetical protein